MSVAAAGKLNRVTTASRLLAGLCLLVCAAVLPARTVSLSDCVQHYIEGDLDEAVHDLSLYLERYPDHRAARNLLAAIQLQLRQPLRVAGTLPEEIAAQDAQAAALRGTALLRSGADLEGFEWLRRAVVDAEPDRLYRLVLSEQNASSTPLIIIDLGDDVLPTDLLEPLRLLEEQAFSEAIALIAGLLEQEPESPLYLYLLGRAYSAQRDYDFARNALNRALERQPQLLSAHLGMAGIALETGDLDTARGHYLNVLRVRDGDVDALDGLVRIARHSGQPVWVREWLEGAWQDHGDPRIGSLLVEALLAEDVIESALEIAGDLRRRHPGQPIPLYSQSLALLADGQYATAAEVLDELTQLQPDSVDAWQLLANARLRTQTLDEAMAALDRAITLAPERLAVRVIRAEVYLLSERYEAALEEAREIQALAPKQSVGYKLEGDVHMQRKDYSDAADAYLAAFEREATAQITLLLNSAYQLAGEHTLALSALRRWLAVMPDDVTVRLQLAMQLQQLGEEDDAVVEYERVLELAPRTLIALNNLAWLYLEHDSEHSVALAEQALELAPDRGEVADTLGWALVHADQPRRAVMVLQQAALMASHVPRIRYHLAVARARTGDSETARAILNELANEPLAPALQEDVERFLGELQSS